MSTSDLPCPDGMSLPDRGVVANQSIGIPAAWWSSLFAEFGLTDAHLVLREGPDGPCLQRSDVWLHAASIEAEPLQLLWHCLAWGAGNRLRQCRARVEAISRERGRYTELLGTAAVLAQTSPRAAYQTLYPRGRSAVPHLGPSFGTKFLYFAGSGLVGHPSPILDSVVAHALRMSYGWPSLRAWGWSADTYQEYSDLLERWATESNAGAGRDQVEYWLFVGQQKPMSQWHPTPKPLPGH